MCQLTQGITGKDSRECTAVIDAWIDLNAERRQASAMMYHKLVLVSRSLQKLAWLDG